MTITQTITALPTAPDRSDSSTFSDRADAFLAALPGMVTEENTFGTQANALATTVNADKVAAAASETAAETAATEAASSANAYIWGDGGSARAFAVGETLIFTDGQAYRCLSVTSAGESPTTDPAKWQKISTRLQRVVIHTTSDTLSLAEVDGTVVHSNLGAGAEVIKTWPGLVAGQSAKFVVEAEEYFQIKAAASSTIRYRDKISVSAGYIRSDVIGDWVEISALSGAKLIVLGMGGTGWNLETS